MTRTGALRRTALLTAAALLLAGIGAAPSEAVPTWRPATIISGAPVDYTSSPQVASDPSGNVTAVWSRPNGAVGGVYATTRPAGGDWAEPVLLSDPARTSGLATLATDAAGTVTAVWRAADGGGGQVVESASKAPGGGWSARTPLGVSGVNSDPVLAVDAAGNAVAAWARVVGGFEIIQASSRPPGGSWTAPEPLSAPIQDAETPRVAMSSATGLAAVTWQRSNGTHVVVQASRRPLGATWSSPADLSDTSKDASLPDVTVDAAGTTTVVWTGDDGTSPRAQISIAPAGAVWSLPEIISLAGQEARNARVAVDPSGATTVIWSQLDGMHYLVKVTSRPAGGAWSFPLTLSDPTNDGVGADVIADPTGGAYASWLQFSGSEWFVQASRRSGLNWAPPTTVGNNAYPYGVSVGVDAAGDAVVSWTSGDPIPTRVRVRVYDVAGPAVGSFSASASGTAGKSMAFWAAATDTWSGVASYAWTFGDGTTGSTPHTAHNYAVPGSYLVTLTVTDGVGNATTRTATTTVAAPVPTIRRFTLTKTKIQTLARGLVRAVARKTRLEVRLNTAAALKLVFKSKHKHLVKGKKRFVRVVLRRQLPAGLSRITIKAKVKGKVLKPDTYRIVGTAKNTTGTSPKKKTKLVVVNAPSG